MITRCPGNMSTTHTVEKHKQTLLGQALRCFRSNQHPGEANTGPHTTPAHVLETQAPHTAKPLTGASAVLLVSMSQCQTSSPSLHPVTMFTGIKNNSSKTLWLFLKKPHTNYHMTQQFHSQVHTPKNCKQRLTQTPVRQCSCSGLVTQSCPTLAIPWTVGCRLLCPWYSPGEETGVGCHFLLQRIFPTQGLSPGLLYCGQVLYRLSQQRSQCSHSTQQPKCGNSLTIH